MARPQFSQMLVDRRRDLGLTLDQAARVLKMKEQVLTAFEEGDWDRIPRSGYAQGMLSSYARYLGLNPRHVIDQFKQDLYAYSHTDEGREGRGPVQASGEHRRLAGYADRYAGQGPRRAPLEDDIDLYGSAGPAGSIMSSGTFDDEMYRRLARERGGHRGVGYSERYLERADDEPRRTRRGDQRAYTNRVPERGPAPRRTPNRQRSSLAASKARDATGQTIQTRAVDDLYEDDLRYDRALPYEAASSEQGRVDSRHIARTERPNLPRTRSDMRVHTREREDGRSGRGADRGGSRDARGSGGRHGRGERGRRSSSRTPSYLAFDARTLAIVVIGLFTVFMVAMILTIGSCVSSVTNSEKPQVPVGTAPTDVSADATAGEDASSADGEGAEGSDAQARGSNQTVQTGQNGLTGTVSQSPDAVTVSVQDGKVSWVEVVMGDVSLVAQTVTGPWERTFQVSAPMEIQASDASAVRVTADGTPVNFDSKTSGVGVIAIAGPEEDDTGDDGDGGDARSQSDDATGTDGSGASTGGSY